MREKELRIALVCFGGVSLAVYMHGISKEILKLVRASCALHAIPDRAARAKASFRDDGEAADPEHDTEAIYFELLREIGRKIELRVIVDVIAGASAGGINGALLARALAHDLPMGALRDLWLNDADVTELLAPEARAKSWSKWFLQPLIWGVAASKRLHEISDPEIRRKLSLFVRSRWFKPPFDGLRMAQLMYDAMTVMGEGTSPARSLLPAGHKLELFVTLTDYYGYQEAIQIHDPPLIQEREHRHVLRFNYRRFPDGEVETELDLANAPALAFAARATSSFPGAFPPAQILEIERLLGDRGIAWPGRDAFLARSFGRHGRAGVNPLATSFVDGSVLNNKPFHEAIQAIKGRPAYRQVDRRLVYIDPDPRQPSPPPSGVAPGFFVTLKGALSDLPRNEPIADELAWVNGFNERVRRLKGIVDAARPQITLLVGEVIGTLPDAPLGMAQVTAWREAINARVARDAGFAYEGYVRLKLAAVRGLVSQLIAGLLRLPPRAPLARAVAEIVDCWALRAGIVYEIAGREALRRETMHDDAAALPRWVKFLLAFDIDFRKRRLAFLIQGQNRLYHLLDETPEAGVTAAAVDRLKRDFYRSLDLLRHREAADVCSTQTRELAQRLFATAPTPAETRRIADYAAAFAERHQAALDELIERLAAEIGLDASTQELDTLLAALDPAVWPAAARREALVNYLGFPFWDVLTLSVTNWRDAGEFDEILIDRISPEDARTVKKLAMATGLKGTGFAHFAAFFSRAYRENDYLLGRLHGADRLIDIVCDATEIDGTAEPRAVLELKRRAFLTILDAEAEHLPHSAELIAALRRDIAAYFAALPLA